MNLVFKRVNIIINFRMLQNRKGVFLEPLRLSASARTNSQTTAVNNL